MAATDSNPSLRSEAKAFVAQEYFHKKFNIPASPNHGDLTFSYADVGVTPDVLPEGTQAPVVLFHPGLFASRYIGVQLHFLAKQMGVRIIIVDRPGFGSSTSVSVEKRVDTWLALVPRLLSHLNIFYVTLVSHCAGTVYALNTLYCHRNILDPQRPMAVLLAPWVDPKHSKVAMMQAAQYIPSPAYSLFNGLSRFAARGIITTVSSSQAVFAAMGIAAPSEEKEQEAKNWFQTNAQAIEKECGVSRKMQNALQERTLQCIFSENTSGSGDEARHCARKASQGSWGKADDYAVFVKDLAQKERSRHGSGSNAGAGAGSSGKLKVKAFFATSDIIIGNGGREYAERCWRGTPGEFDDAFDFDSRIIDGSDHDGLVLSMEVWKAVVADIRGVTTQTYAD